MKDRKLSKRKRKEQKDLLPLIQELWEGDNPENWTLAIAQAETFGISAKKLCRAEVMYDWFRNDVSKIHRRGGLLVRLLTKGLSNEALLGKDPLNPFALRVGKYMNRVIVGLGFKLMKEKGDRAIVGHWNMWSIRFLPLSGHQIHKVKKQIGIKRFNFIP